MEAFAARNASADHFAAAKAEYIDVSGPCLPTLKGSPLRRMWGRCRLGGACVCAPELFLQDVSNLKFGQVYQQAQRVTRYLMRTTRFSVPELLEAAGTK